MREMRVVTRRNRSVGAAIPSGQGAAALDYVAPRENLSRLDQRARVLACQFEG
jgi:thiamine biosynthesis protein ThiC